MTYQTQKYISYEFSPKANILTVPFEALVYVVERQGFKVDLYSSRALLHTVKQKQRAKVSLETGLIGRQRLRGYELHSPVPGTPHIHRLQIAEENQSCQLAMNAWIRTGDDVEERLMRLADRLNRQYAGDGALDMIIKISKHSKSLGVR